MPNQPLTRGEYARAHRKDILLMAVAWIILATGMIWSLYAQQALIDDNDTARQGICVLRQDLAVRVKASERLLEENVTLGFPRTVIQQNLNNQKRTLEALDVVHCHD